MKVKVIQLAIVPVFALSACTDDDPNRKAMPTQQSQAQVVRHDDGSYSRPTTPATAQLVDSQQLKTGRISANQANSQPCQNPSANHPQPQQQGMTQQPCESSGSSGSGGGSSAGGGGGGGSSSSTYNSGGQHHDQMADNQRHSTTRMGFASRVSPDVIDSRRNVMVKSRGGFGASGGFGRAGG